MNKTIDLTQEEVQFLFDRLQYQEYSSETLNALFENIITECRNMLRVEDRYDDVSIIVMQNTLNSLVDSIQRYQKELEHNTAYTILQKIQE